MNDLLFPGESSDAPAHTETRSASTASELPPSQSTTSSYSVEDRVVHAVHDCIMSSHQDVSTQSWLWNPRTHDTGRLLQEIVRSIRGLGDCVADDCGDCVEACLGGISNRKNHAALATNENCFPIVDSRKHTAQSREPLLQASWLARARTAFSMCTGSGTAECARSVLQKTVNDSNLVDWNMDIRTVCQWVWNLKKVRGFII